MHPYRQANVILTDGPRSLGLIAPRCGLTGSGGDCEKRVDKLQCAINPGQTAGWYMAQDEARAIAAAPSQRGRDYGSKTINPQLSKLSLDLSACIQV